MRSWHYFKNQMKLMDMKWPKWTMKEPKHERNNERSKTWKKQHVDTWALNPCHRNFILDAGESCFTCSKSVMVSAQSKKSGFFRSPSCRSMKASSPRLSELLIWIVALLQTSSPSPSTSTEVYGWGTASKPWQVGMWTPNLPLFGLSCTHCQSQSQ